MPRLKGSADLLEEWRGRAPGQRARRRRNNLRRGGDERGRCSRLRSRLWQTLQQHLEGGVRGGERVLPSWMQFSLRRDFNDWTLYRHADAPSGTTLRPSYAVYLHMEIPLRDHAAARERRRFRFGAQAPTPSRRPAEMNPFQAPPSSAERQSSATCPGASATIHLITTEDNRQRGACC